MREPVRRLDEWRSRTARRVRDPNAVGRGAEANALLERPRARRGGGTPLGDLGDHTEPEAMDRADHTLRGPVVPHRLPRRLDPAIERRRCDVAMAPHAVEQLLLGHDPVPRCEQVREHVEHLRLDMQALARTAQLMEPRVELVVAERVDQVIWKCCRHVP